MQTTEMASSGTEIILAPNFNQQVYALGNNYCIVYISSMGAET